MFTNLQFNKKKKTYNNFVFINYRKIFVDNKKYIRSLFLSLEKISTN